MYIKRGANQFEELEGDGQGRLKATDEWVATLKIDEAADDSDKKFLVATGEEWIVKSIWIELTTTADAGDRLLVVEIQDTADDVVDQVRVGIVQAASITRYYHLAPGAPNLTAFIDTDYLSTPIPEWHLPAGYDIRVYDVKAIQAGADDMIVQMMTLVREAGS